jgi:hypothetical protein
MRKFIGIDIKHVNMLSQLHDCICYIGVVNTLNKSFDNRLVVFDSKTILNNYSNCEWVDVTKLRKQSIDPVKYIRGLDAKTYMASPILRKNFLLDILETHKNSGILTDYMGILYKIHSKALRVKIKNSFYRLLTEKTNPDGFIADVTSYFPKRGKTLQYLEELKAISKSDNLKTLVLAFKEYSKTKNIDEVVKNFSVTSYDIRYIEAMNDKKEQAK